MAIVDQQGQDIFTTTADALVNPVNCKGVMGAGLALQFKRRFPANFVAYQDACQKGILRPGGLFCYRLADQDKLIINMATKDHWRDNSKIADIERGLYLIKECSLEYSYRSVALPKVGCGLGGLCWPTQVEPLVREIFQDSKLVVVLY